MFNLQKTWERIKNSLSKPISLFGLKISLWQLFQIGLFAFAFFYFLSFALMLLTISWLDDYIKEILSSNLFFHPALANSISIVLSVFLVFALKKHIHHYKKLTWIIAISFSLYNLTIYYSIRARNFDVNGSPLKCEAHNPILNTMEDCACGNVIHPSFGTPIRHKGQTINRVTPNSNTIFFTSNGEPLIYYFKSENGQYELFDNSGFHPQGTGTIKPVTPEVVQDIRLMINNAPHMIHGVLTQLPKRIWMHEKINFFSPNGKPLVYYSEESDDQIHLFDSFGFNPKNGKLLSPMDKKIASKISNIFKKKPHLINQSTSSHFSREKGRILDQIKNYCKESGWEVFDDLTYFEKYDKAKFFNLKKPRDYMIAEKIIGGTRLMIFEDGIRYSMLNSYNSDLIYFLTYHEVKELKLSHHSGYSDKYTNKSTWFGLSSKRVKTGTTYVGWISFDENTFHFSEPYETEDFLNFITFLKSKL